MGNAMCNRCLDRRRRHEKTFTDLIPGTGVMVTGCNVSSDPDVRKFETSVSYSGVSPPNEKKESLYLVSSSQSLLPPQESINNVQEDKKSAKSHQETLVSDSKIHFLFDKYENDGDCILSEGMERLCKDLELRPDEFRVLILAWKCRAEQMCRFTRSEFLSGCRSLKSDSLKKLRRGLTDVADNDVTDISHSDFRDLYRFTYKFGLEDGQRVLSITMAISLWRLVFSGLRQQPPIIPRWIRFLEKHPYIRGIPRDTWNMFLNFLETVGDDLSAYDDSEAWPSLLDDFVEFENDETNQNFVKIKVQ